ncbi:MAG TPA: caspase family protein, partial [Thermoanaerobaculia bacterium]
MESPNYRAVLIGIDDYPKSPLSGCVNDIDQIERILLDRLKVPAERITRFAAPQSGAATTTRLPSSPKPTCDELRSFLRRLA